MNIFNRFIKIYVVLLNLGNCVLCFDVQFRAIYDAVVEPFNTQIYKRELTQFFDKAAYTFNGFKQVESIPVTFPLDICVLDLNGVKYATSLHKSRDGKRHFAVHKMNNGTYELLADLPSPNAIALDCKTLGSKGYIAIANNFSTPVENARDGSPIYELSDDRLRPIQFFGEPNLFNVYLRVQGNDLLLLHTYKNTKSSPNLYCPYFIWSGTTFHRLGRIPCSNARHLEPFSIDYENYVAVANYANQQGRTATNSEIYKFIREKRKFQLSQKIKTYGAVDVRYFSVPVDAARRQHFLIFGNSISSNSDAAKNLEADSVFYVYDKSGFVPYQNLKLYAVEQFLPIQNIDAEKFLLVIACTNQETKIYNLNDWKFEESKAQFTAGAFGKGVSRMRTFQQQDENYLVIANEFMAENETNIFIPIFKQEEHANALRQQVIEWAKENIARFSQIDVEKLKNEVDKKLQQQKQHQPLKPQPTMSEHLLRNIPHANIGTVQTAMLIHPNLHMSTNYWKALTYASRALNALEAHHRPPNPPHQLHKRSASIEDDDDVYDYEHIKVKNLVVKKKLNAEFINGIQINEPAFKTIKAKKVIVTGEYIGPLAADNVTTQTLNIKNLRIGGKINGFSWDELYNDTLKRAGPQFIKSTATFKNLNASTVTVTSGEISGTQISKLVPISGGDYIVAEHILFEAPITAKNVVIHDRLNQIHIFQNNFDVLLKKSNKTQIITGLKRMEQVRLLQPIQVSGSMPSNHLRAIAPNKALHEDLVLHGDYVINGNVTIRRTLSASDLLDNKTNISAKRVMENGLRLDLPMENVNLIFEAPIVANNSQLSFINTRDMQQLLKTNTVEPQLIEGLKIFKQNLSIENGFCEVKLLNGIDVLQLEKRVLVKHTNQTITAPMHLGKILVKGLHASNLTLHNKDLSKFLTKTGNQHINGTLKVKVLEVENMHAHNLNSNDKIFEHQLTEIYQQTPKNLANLNIFPAAQKYNGTIYVKNLVMNTTLNEKSVFELERLLTQLDGNVKYVGNYKFNYAMEIKNLTFFEQINGIKATKFGNAWLQKTGDQTFTAPQTIASVVFKQGGRLFGKLNGYELQDFYTQTYWTDRNEYIKQAIFQNPIELQTALYTNTLNRFYVPSDILYRQSRTPQSLQMPIIIEKDVHINGDILNTTIFNDIDLEMLENYLCSPTDNSTLYVNSAVFNYAPKYDTLNNYELEKTLDMVWLANENVALPYHVEIAEAYFEGLLDLEGPINNMNLKYLKRNYFSRAKPQTILTEAVFTQNVTFQSDVKTDEINLIGDLIETKSKTQFNFNEFVSNSLKTSGAHEVRGNWTLLEVVIAGSLQDVTINGLNFVTDVVRLDSENIITGEKRIANSATIEKLFVSAQSTINHVEIAHWFKTSVNKYRNETIYGKTILDDAILQNIFVRGNVNNIIFSKENLFLRDEAQEVHGSITIRNKLGAEQRILANNIENLETTTVNGVVINEFFENVMKTSDIWQPQKNEVQGQLIFEQPLVVGEYKSGNVKDASKWKRETAATTKHKWNALKSAVEKLRKLVQSKPTNLDDIEVNQFLPIQATKLLTLSILVNNVIYDIIALGNDTMMNDTNTVKFYRWNDEFMCFVPFNDASTWLPRDFATLEVVKLIFGTADYLVIKQAHEQMLGKNIVSNQFFNELLQLRKNDDTQLSALFLNGKDCIALYSRSTNTKVQIYCLDLNIAEPLLNINKTVEIETHAQQVLMISHTEIAFLVDDVVEIRETTKDLKILQQLNLVNTGIQMATTRVDNVTYLAIVTLSKANSLIKSSIAIYSAVNNSKFKHEQTIESSNNPQKIELCYSARTADLLLLVHTDSNVQSIVIYQYQGIANFQPIFDGGILGAVHQMQLLHFKQNQMHQVALFNANGLILLNLF